MDGFEILVTGEGVIEAIEASRRNGDQVAFVYDRDARGQIVRIGYTVDVDGGEQAIKWFSPSDVQVSVRPGGEQLFSAKLNVQMVHPKAHERHHMLEIPAGDGLRLTVRLLFRVHPDGQPDFVVQVEARDSKSGCKQRPVVRYDCAHGHLHRDHISKRGRKSKQTVSDVDTSADAMRQIVDELVENLPAWLTELGYEAFNSSPLAHPSLRSELGRLGQVLEELLEEPSRMEETQSELVAYTGEILKAIPSADGQNPIRSKADLLKFLAANPQPGVPFDAAESLPDEAVINRIKLPGAVGEPLTIDYAMPEPGGT